MAASAAALLGESHYSESSSFVFDDQTDPSASYRKEIAHMSRHFRLHVGSFLAIEIAKGLNMLPKSDKEENRFESVTELYEAGRADYIFNFVLGDLNTMEEKLVAP